MNSMIWVVDGDLDVATDVAPVNDDLADDSLLTSEILTFINIKYKSWF